MQSQNLQVLNYLKRHASITHGDSFLKLGVARLAARIHDLRGMGHDIFTDMVKENGKRFARYTLIKENTNG